MLGEPHISKSGRSSERLARRLLSDAHKLERLDDLRGLISGVIKEAVRSNRLSGSALLNNDKEIATILKTVEDASFGRETVARKRLSVEWCLWRHAKWIRLAIDTGSSPPPPSQPGRGRTVSLEAPREAQALLSAAVPYGRLSRAFLARRALAVRALRQIANADRFPNGRNPKDFDEDHWGVWVTRRNGIAIICGYGWGYLVTPNGILYVPHWMMPHADDSDFWARASAEAVRASHTPDPWVIIQQFGIMVPKEPMQQVWNDQVGGQVTALFLAGVPEHMRRDGW